MATTKLIDELLDSQRGVVATWQLTDAGLPKGTATDQVAKLRSLFDGVHLSGHAPPTPWQQAMGATLTTPKSVLDGWPVLILRGLDRDWPGASSVVRLGSGGRRRYPAPAGPVGVSLDVRHSTVLDGDRIRKDGIPMLTVPRTVRDLLPGLSGDRRERLVRDVLRLKLATAPELWAQVARHPGGRGVAILKALVDEYAPLELGRERSDAEVVARSVLRAAGVDEPGINRVIAGWEADLIWWARRLILELDGPQYHQFLRRDAKIQAAWEQAGWVVRRLPTDDVYDRPDRLLIAATAPVSRDELLRAGATRHADDVLERWSSVGRYEWSKR